MVKPARDRELQSLIRENARLNDQARMRTSEIKRLRAAIHTLLAARDIEREFSKDDEIPF